METTVGVTAKPTDAVVSLFITAVIPAKWRAFDLLRGHQNAKNGEEDGASCQVI